MDITELSHRTGLGTRRLRYVIEYQILPPLEGLTPGRGAGREFNDFTGFCIALAASLMERGLRRDIVKKVMETILEFRRPGLPVGSVMFPALQNAFAFAKRSTLEIGDGCNVRIVSDPPHLQTGKDTIQPMSLPWTQMDTGARLADRYEPTVTIVVRLDLLAGQVRA